MRYAWKRFSIWTCTALDVSRHFELRHGTPINFHKLKSYHTPRNGKSRKDIVWWQSHKPRASRQGCRLVDYIGSIFDCKLSFPTEMIPIYIRISWSIFCGADDITMTGTMCSLFVPRPFKHRMCMLFAERAQLSKQDKREGVEAITKIFWYKIASRISPSTDAA